jgi:AAA-like domain
MAEQACPFAGLALVISTERNLLIDDATASPFNIGLHVVLRPFSLAEGQQLNQRYQQHSGFALVEDEVVQLWELLGGQPYLMRQAYHALSTGQVPSFAGLLDDASRDDSIFADHLRAVLKRLRLRPDYRLTTAFRQIIHGRKVSVQEAVPRLQSAGLVRYDGQRSVPASTLYARFFGRVL